MEKHERFETLEFFSEECPTIHGPDELYLLVQLLHLASHPFVASAHSLCTFCVSRAPSMQFVFKPGNFSVHWTEICCPGGDRQLNWREVYRFSIMLQFKIRIIF